MATQSILLCLGMYAFFFVCMDESSRIQCTLPNLLMFYFFIFHISHEIAGIVTKVGPNVHRFNVGDHVGVGTYVNSCRDCEYCNEKQEVLCTKGSVFTFNGVDFDGTITKGGYSSYIVVHER